MRYGWDIPLVKPDCEVQDWDAEPAKVIVRDSHICVEVLLWRGGAPACTLVLQSPLDMYLNRHIQTLLCFQAIIFRKISKSSGLLGSQLDQNNFLWSIKTVVTLRVRPYDVCLFSLESCHKSSARSSVCKQGNNAEVLFSAGCVMFPCPLLAEKLFSTSKYTHSQGYVLLTLSFLFCLLEKVSKLGCSVIEDISCCTTPPESFWWWDREKARFQQSGLYWHSQGVCGSFLSS